MKRIHLASFARRIAHPSTVTTLILGGMLVGGSSCSTASKYVKDTFRRDSTAVADAEKEEDVDGKNFSDSKSLNPLKHANAEKKVAKERSKETEKSVSDIDAAIADGRDPFASVIQRTSVQSFEPNTTEESVPKPDNWIPEIDQKAVSAIQHQAEPRQPIDNPFATTSVAPSIDACPPTAACAARPFPSAEYIGDELICDGGDKGIPVHYQGNQRAGLDTEDTIAEFRDHEGNFHVKPSTETCIYAPRFGAVRSSTLPAEDLAIDKALGHQDQTGVAGFDTKTVIDEKAQWDEAVGIQTRSRASGLERPVWDGHVNQTVAAENHVKLMGANENFAFLKAGRIDRTNTAIIGRGINASLEWADGRRPIIVAHDQAGQIVQGEFSAQAYTSYEDLRKAGDLTIVKVADKAVAHPGDIVTFTIRFDNVGDRELTGVRVVDNLSPRLEYIENSIESNLDGLVDVTDNGVGGKLLSFEFDKPLQGHTGGYVSFSCRVR